MSELSHRATQVVQQASMPIDYSEFSVKQAGAGTLSEYDATLAAIRSVSDAADRLQRRIAQAHYNSRNREDEAFLTEVARKDFVSSVLSEPRCPLPPSLQASVDAIAHQEWHQLGSLVNSIRSDADRLLMGTNAVASVRASAEDGLDIVARQDRDFLVTTLPLELIAPLLFRAIIVAVATVLLLGGSSRLLDSIIVWTVVAWAVLEVGVFIDLVIWLRSRSLEDMQKENFAGSGYFFRTGLHRAARGLM